RPGESPGSGRQRERLRAAAAPLAALARRHALVLTHGNGPQIGWLANREGAAALDELGAESEGWLGYLIEQELAPLLAGREIATLLTQVEVDPADPAFRAPSKPIGPLVDEGEAERLRRERGWHFAPSGRGRFAPSGGRLRRVVPSPEPVRIRELGAIAHLVAAGVIVICAGGGGVPVVAGADGSLRGVEAVVDKDRSAALLAEALDADALLLLTDVDAVYDDWPDATRPIRRAAPAELRARRFEPGSMGPKVEAACRFAERTGRPAYVGALDAAEALLAGAAGTCVAP
ncbi:MAG: carbamate kinase, partial [Myxococcota bacterium]